MAEVLGNFEYGIDINSDELKESTKKVNKAFDELGKSTKKVKGENKDFGKVLKDAIPTINRHEKASSKAATRLDKMGKVVEVAGESFKKLEKNVEKSEQVIKGTISPIGNLSNAIMGLTAQMQRLDQKTKEANDELNKTGKKSGGLGKKISGAIGKIKGYATVMTGAAIGAGLLAKKTLEMGEAWANTERILKVLTQETGDYAEVHAKLLDLSNKSGVSFDDMVRNFQGFQLAAKDLGRSNESLLGTFDKITAVATKYGVAADDMSGALLQIQQSLSKPRIELGEWNVVIERAPILAKEMAEGVGMSFSELNQKIRSNEGISGKFLLEMMEKIKIGAVEQLNTIEAAAGRMSNAFGQLFSEAYEKEGTFDFVVEIMDEISTYIKENKDEINEMIRDLTNFVQLFIAGLKQIYQAAQTIGKALGLEYLGRILKKSLQVQVDKIEVKKALDDPVIGGIFKGYRTLGYTTEKRGGGGRSGLVEGVTTTGLHTEAGKEEKMRAVLGYYKRFTKAGARLSKGGVLVEGKGDEPIELNKKQATQLLKILYADMKAEYEGNWISKEKFEKIQEWFDKAMESLKPSEGDVGLPKTWRKPKTTSDKDKKARERAAKARAKEREKIEKSLKELENFDPIIYGRQSAITSTAKLMGIIKKIKDAFGESEFKFPDLIKEFNEISADKEARNRHQRKLLGEFTQSQEEQKIKDEEKRIREEIAERNRQGLIKGEMIRKQKEGEITEDLSKKIKAEWKDVESMEFKGKTKIDVYKYFAPIKEKMDKIKKWVEDISEIDEELAAELSKKIVFDEIELKSRKDSLIEAIEEAELIQAEKDEEKFDKEIDKFKSSIIARIKSFADKEWRGRDEKERQRELEGIKDDIESNRYIDAEFEQEQLNELVIINENHLDKLQELREVAEEKKISSIEEGYNKELELMLAHQKRMQEAYEKWLENARSYLEESSSTSMIGAKKLIDQGREAFKKYAEASRDVLTNPEDYERFIQREEARNKALNEGIEERTKLRNIEAVSGLMLTSRTEDERLKIVTNAFDKIGTTIAKSGKLGFQVMKSLAIAKAIINSKESAIAAYKWGVQIGGSPAVGAIASAAVLAETAIMIAEIRKTKPEGRRFGGMVTGQGGIYEVNESKVGMSKIPEILTTRGKDYLTMDERQTGYITPLKKGHLGGTEPPRINIKINNNTDTTPSVEYNQRGDETDIDILIERIKGDLVSDVNEGGTLSEAYSNNFGLTRQG